MDPEQETDAMDDDTAKMKARDPHLHDAATGTRHGVPEGAAGAEATGLPDSGRHETETAPIHPDAGKDQARDI
jgi:hypothetical protein